ncbi:MAG: gamma carbonic anhydrase family protein [Leptospiraceae bacterium]|nr:gamma carbonic anhydrase family protein [Leptospiraceae bacterium]MCP5500275.1 gamma carbonic anhydrase family protein [Leptospiraceae bacterium]
MIYTYKGIQPKIADSAFIAPSSEIIGDVEIGEQTSIWFQTLLRGDVNYIRVGNFCNIQDMSLVHVSKGTFPTIIGNHVSIGHRATIHGCVLKDFSFVGMGATVMDDVEIGEYSFVAAGALVTPGKKFPSGVMIMGSPAKIVRDITDKERNMILGTAKNYSEYGAIYKNSGEFYPV